MDSNTYNSQQGNFFTRTFTSIKSYFSYSNPLKSNNIESPSMVEDFQCHNNRKQNHIPQRKNSMPLIVPQQTSVDFIQQHKPKKINPIIGITQYITNSKFNEDKSNEYTRDCTYNSAFSMLTHNISPSLLNQRKQIINYNDFSISSELQPISISSELQPIFLNQKHQREENKQNKIINDMPFGNNAAFSNSKINRSKTSHIILPQSMIDKKEKNNQSNSLEKICLDIEKKNRSNNKYLDDLKELSTINKGMLSYEDRANYLNDYYLAKLTRLKAKKGLLNSDKRKNIFTDLIYGHGEAVMVAGLPKNRLNTINQDSKLVAEKEKPFQDNNSKKIMLNSSFLDKNTPNTIEVLEKESIQCKPKGSNLFNFGSYEANAKEQTKNVFLCGDSLKTAEQSNNKKPLFDINEKKAISFELFSPLKVPELKKNPNLSTSFFNDSKNPPSLFQVPKEKFDECKDAKYESVILNNVSFGVPKEKNDKPDAIKDSFEDEELSLHSKKSQIKGKRKDYSTKLFNNQKPKEKILFNFEATQQNSYSLFPRDKKIINEDIKDQKPHFIKEKTNKYEDNKYESVILNKGALGAPKENKDIFLFSDKKMIIDKEPIQPKEAFNLFKVPKEKSDEVKDTNYESVILSKVCFGVPKETNSISIKEEPSKPIISLFNNKLSETKDIIPSLETKSPLLISKEEQIPLNPFLKSSSENYEKKPTTNSGLFDSKPIDNIPIFGCLYNYSTSLNAINPAASIFSNLKSSKNNTESIEAGIFANTKKRGNLFDNSSEEKMSFITTTNENINKGEIVNELFNQPSLNQSESIFGNSNSTDSKSLFGSSTTSKSLFHNNDTGNISLFSKK